MSIHYGFIARDHDMIIFECQVTKDSDRDFKSDAKDQIEVMDSDKNVDIEVKDSV
jgi:hypothetical protein